MKDRGNGAGRGGKRGGGGVGGGSGDEGRKLMDGYQLDFKCLEGEKIIKLKKIKRPRENKPPKPLADRKAGRGLEERT